MLNLLPIMCQHQTQLPTQHGLLRGPPHHETILEHTRLLTIIDLVLIELLEAPLTLGFEVGTWAECAFVHLVDLFD